MAHWLFRPCRVEELTPPQREDSECERDIITPFCTATIFISSQHFSSSDSMLGRNKNRRNISYYSMHTPHDLLRICFVKGKNSVPPNPKSFRPFAPNSVPTQPARSSDSNPPISLLRRRCVPGKTSRKESHLAGAQDSAKEIRDLPTRTVRREESDSFREIPALPASSNASHGTWPRITSRGEFTARDQLSRFLLDHSMIGRWRAGAFPFPDKATGGAGSARCGESRGRMAPTCTGRPYRTLLCFLFDF